MCIIYTGSEKKEGLRMSKKCKCYLNAKTALKASKGLHGGYKCPIHDTHFAPPMLVSELAGHHNRIRSQSYVFVQPKLNGWCCMANTRTRKIYTRAGHEIKTLPHINAALPVDGPEWLHGELYRHDSTLDEIQSMIKRGSDEIEFHVFDLVDSEPFEARVSYLFAKYEFFWNGNNNPLKIVPSFKIKTDQIINYYQNFLNRNYEGIIIRLDGHGYEHHRSINVFKMKPDTEVI
jgi:hypothetical protein